MRRAAVTIALLSALVASCATLRGNGGSSAESRYEQGLAALAAQDFGRARTLLEGVYREQWQHSVGQRALLALTALELDSRNPERRLWSAADLAARYLNIDDTPRWTVPLAESLYLLAVELGGHEEELAQAQADKAQAEAALRTAQQSARRLPQSSRETVPARLRQAAAERDRLAGERDEMQKRIAALEQRLAAREKELKDAQQELERIRRTLKK